MAIPPAFIQELIARSDVVEIIGRHVQLKKGGANFMGLCPFHAEKSSSFSVSPTKQFYHCFGCGKNGNAIGFLMDHLGMSFIETVKDLAQQYGMVVPEDDASPQERQRALAQRQKQATLSDVLEKAGDAFKKHLKATPRASDYLKGRGLSGAVAKDFGIGYAPEGWRSLASVFPDYSSPLLVESGLVILNQDEDSGEEKRYDRFRDRIMFPIRNIKGDCIGFGGRVLGEGSPKYLNSPETPVFSKGRELYGLFEARHALRELGYVLVTEGYMDVVALAQLGFPNAVATLGTACTNDHVQKLFRFTDAVVFSFDGDAAGRRAARKALDAALPFATDVRNVKFLFLPPEHDPDSFIRAHGKEAFADFIAQATPLSRFLLDAVREGCDPNSAEGRAKMATQAMPLWTGLPDGALKRQLLGDIGEQVQLAGRELLDLWRTRMPPSRGVARSTPYVASAGTAHETSDAALHGRTDWGPPLENYQNDSNERTPHLRKKPFSSKFQAERQSRDFKPPFSPGRRLRPASRADHAARLLLTNSRSWNTLTSEDHTMLCELPAPHGLLFAWLDNQVHEYGPQPWAALREGLRERDTEDMALRLMSATEPESPPDTVGSDAELRGLIDLMLNDWLMPQETAALLASKTDPVMRQRYYDINARRRQLLSASQGADFPNPA